MRSQDKILALFESFNELTIKEIVDKIGVSKQMAHLVVNRLRAENKLEKLGRAPKTVYRLLRKESKSYQGLVAEPSQEYDTIPEGDRNILDKNFVVVTETGDLLEGSEAFR